jgi:hypothetical protein
MFCHTFGDFVGDVAYESRQVCFRIFLGDVEPVDRFGEPEIGVDAGDHDASVDGQQLDADD